MDRLDVLWAERAIGRVLGDYCDRVDRNDVDGIVALFTPDGEFDLGRGRVYRGAAGLRELYARVARNRLTSHHVGNVRVDLTGPDTARVRCAMYAYHVRRDSGDEVRVWGQYLDEFARVGPDDWRIRFRALRISGERGDPSYEYLPRS